MTVRKTYYPTEGLLSFTDSALAYVKMLELDRNGMVYNKTDLTTLPSDTGLFYGHNNATGTIEFLIPFNLGESINVIYETNP